MTNPFADGKEYIHRLSLADVGFHITRGGKGLPNCGSSSRRRSINCRCTTSGFGSVTSWSTVGGHISADFVVCG